MNSLGKNALCLKKEKHISFGNTTSDFSCTSLSIPYPAGLGQLLASVDVDIVIGEGFFQMDSVGIKIFPVKKNPFAYSI